MPDTRILVVAEHDNAVLKEGTLATITAATQLGGAVDLLLIGTPSPTLTDTAARCEGIAALHTFSDKSLTLPVAEHLAPLIAAHAGRYRAIVMPSSSYGKDVLPRVAALLDVSPVSDIIEILSPTTFKRAIYAGNAIATIETTAPQVCMTIRTTAFGHTTIRQGNPVPIEAFSLPPTSSTLHACIIGQAHTDTTRPELTAARIVLSGGRGFGSAEKFRMLESLADLMGAAVGASRAAVDAGFAPNDYQVGQTGKMVAPDLYMAFGISGAIQHLAGMKESQVIVAINKDENAPIFEISDYYLVADLFQIIPELETLLRSRP